MADWIYTMTGLSPARRDAMEFLWHNLPISDLDCYSFEYFLTCVDHALMVRERFSWCRALEKELFYHYVLCPRVNDEDLSNHRALFYKELCHRVEGLAVEEAVLEVNRWCHEWASYQFQDDRTASPLTVFLNGSGRCGEESAFLVAALRSVGIAARQVYAPRWSHCDDNHAWVEALCGEKWNFLGACEPEPILNRGWFNTASSRAMLIHSRTFGRGSSPLHGVPLGTEGAVTWYNQTTRYAKTQEYTLRVTRKGMPAAGARVYLQVLNEASYHTIATLTADEQGVVTVILGLGDLHVLAVLDGLWAEGDCKSTAVTLELTTAAEWQKGWVELDVHAPKDEPIHPASLTEEQKRARCAVLERGNQIRTARINARFDPIRAAGFPEDLLRDARGNFDSIHTFLGGENRGARERLARTITGKDLRDTPWEVLEDHLARTVARSSNIPEEIYRDYVISPRVGVEKLTAWRGPLSAWLEGQGKELFRENPKELWYRLDSLLYREEWRIYDNLCWPPVAALIHGRCDARSRELLFVAILRALGVPARLRPLDGRPEYWKDGAFHGVIEERMGTLCLKRTWEQNPLYRQNWSLSRRTKEGWQLLMLNDSGWQGEEYPVTLPEGAYRLMTSVRLPNGNQFAARRDFVVEASGTICISMHLRSFALEDLLGAQDMPVISAQNLAGESVVDVARSGHSALLFWMEEGGEPTEHVLNELAAAQRVLEHLPVRICFLLRGKDSLKQLTLAGVLEQWPDIEVLLDDWAFDLETVARHLSCDPDRPPLAVVCDEGGRAVYGVSGYHVGSVELMTRIAAHLCQKN